jgi:hypothetical protein
MKHKKLNKIQKKADRDRRVKEAMCGEGLFVYANNTKGDLYLPKPTNSGKRVVGVGEEFQGDSYYITLVKNNQLRLIRELVAVPQKGEPMTEQKLILDQPDRVTNKGTVEQVIPAHKNQLNEGQPAKNPEPKQEVLLTEDPLDGVEILLN